LTPHKKVAGKVTVLDRALEDSLPYLFGLLGLSDEHGAIAGVEAQTRKRRALDAIKRIILRESLNQPLIVIFEDLHWIDEESQAFLNLLADSIGTARILMLVNYRPEYRHQWNGKTYYIQLRLDPLLSRMRSRIARPVRTFDEDRSRASGTLPGAPRAIYPLRSIAAACADLEQILRNPGYFAAVGHEAEGDAALALDRHGVVQIENLAIGHQVLSVGLRHGSVWAGSRDRKRGLRR
jgi:hypothetical protein